MRKKTKIIATIGPSSYTPPILKKLAEVGVDVARFNFSHADYEKTSAWFKSIRDNNLPMALMLDTKGPEIRTGEVRGALELNEGDKVTFTIEQGVYEDTKKVSVNYENFLTDIRAGETIVSIDSGAFFVKILSVNGKDAIGEVIKGSGKITTKRHINFTTGEDTTQPTLGDKDWKDIDFGIKEKVDFIALSFTITAKDIEDLREYCAKRGHVPAIIPKIENQKGIDNLEEIIRASDGVMVARGDLSDETPYYNVPKIQREIIEMGHLYSKPVIVATQMILSMCDNIRPTRAEINDVATAVLLGADVIMTSDETGKGKYPVESIETMSEIASHNEEQLEYLDELVFSNDDDNVTIIKGAIENLKNTSVGAVVVITKSGKIINQLAESHISQHIYAFTDNELSTNKARLSFGIIPNTIEFSDDYEKTIGIAISKVKKDNSEIKKVLIISYQKVNGNEYPLISVRNI
jgi:pyruvate kinase